MASPTIPGLPRPGRRPRLGRPGLAAGLAAALALPGCFFQNASPVVRLGDQVQALNSDLRWGRLDLAIQMVAPAYRARFLDARRAWGEDGVQVADSDVLGIRVVEAGAREDPDPGEEAETADEDRDAAISTVDIRWYSMRTLTVRRTTVQQRWERFGRDYLLAEEAITGGDAALLAGVPVVPSDPPAALPATDGADRVGRGPASRRAGLTAGR
jgi:hypothetical protein